METLDSTDLQILRTLQRNAKLTTKELADVVHLTPTPVFERQKRLERQGYIYTVKGRGNFVKGNTSMLDNKKQELITEITELFTEAADIGISVDELFTEIRSRLQENKGGKA